MNKNKKTINRKNFIKKAALSALTGASLLSCKPKLDSKESSIAIISQKKYKWKMVTTWPPNFPVLGEACNHFAQWVKEMTGGQISINVYGGGELIPALECFEAVSSGAVEIGSGASYYWAGRSPATQFFTTVPFGMNAQQMNSWLYCGGGQELWKELYAGYNLVPFPAGNTGVQMAGWFNREINTIEDFKGLKMRIPGLGGKVLERAGGSAVLSAGSEIYTNLERGVIDATEWIGPYHDYNMGFHKIAKYYYTPGWHETGSTLEVFFNKPIFDSLEPHLQTILETAAYRMNAWTLAEFEAKNNEYLQKLIQIENVELRQFSSGVLIKLKDYTNEILTDITVKDEASAKIYKSYDAFRKNIKQWSSHSEKPYHNLL